jgi:hypothetical protein
VRCILLVSGGTTVNKVTLGLVGVVVCGLTVGVAAWLVPLSRAGSTTIAAAEPAAEPVKWECAEFRVTTHPYWNVATTGEDEPKREFVLNLPDKSHKFDTFAGLAGPLGRKPGQETAAEVLSILGQDGWEPVGFAATEWVNPGRAIKRTEVWALKRPAKK